jgi:hypothetical protein
VAGDQMSSGGPARGKIVFYGRPRGEPLRGREDDCRSNRRGEDRNRRSRAGIAASGGGASQNATNAMMTDRIAARGAGPGSVLDAANSAREGDCCGRRECGEEALQQKRIERECADRERGAARSPGTIAAAL